MNAAEARSLVEHINGHSTHTFAYTMTFGERTWVILHDTTAPQTVPCEEPILEVRDYLERLQRSASRCPVNAEVRGLFEEWLAPRGGTDTEYSTSRLPAAQVRTSLASLPPAAAS
jgi:hypothetical protein